MQVQVQVSKCKYTSVRVETLCLKNPLQMHRGKLNFCYLQNRSDEQIGTCRFQKFFGTRTPFHTAGYTAAHKSWTAQATRESSISMSVGVTVAPLPGWCKWICSKPCKASKLNCKGKVPGTPSAPGLPWISKFNRKCTIFAQGFALPVLPLFWKFSAQFFYKFI